jgi:uncharacterized protein
MGGEDPAHGWEHVQRVYHLSLHLAEQENADSFIAGMAALLHDLGRTTHDPLRSHAERSVVLATELLASFDLPPETHGMRNERVEEGRSFLVSEHRAGQPT